MDGYNPVKTPLRGEDLHDKIPFSGRQARILVAPLDWGLGHTTRCIPVIRELIRQDCSVFFAGNEEQLALMKNEFSGITFLPLEGYQIKYARSPKIFSLKIILQAPKILQTIKKEHQWLGQMMQDHAFDAVISDNRYGLYHKNAHCIFMTHQLAIQSSLGRLSRLFLRRKNYSYINKFDTCWVPDEKGEDNLAGKLSHPGKLPAVPVNYIGILSRFKKQEIPEKKDHLLVLVSGPEPQRTIFEDIVLDELVRFEATATIVRGLPASKNILPSTNQLHIYNHLPAEILNEEMMKAEYIISRCGYSTVMDLAVLQKRSILIPTPGQTEQEWLAKYLYEKKFALCIPQTGFSLRKALENAATFSYRPAVDLSGTPLSVTIEALINTLKTHQKGE